MNFLKIIIAVLFLLIIGGIAFVAFAPTNITQKEVTQTISLSDIQ